MSVGQILLLVSWVACVGIGLVMLEASIRKEAYMFPAWHRWMLRFCVGIFFLLASYAGSNF